MAFTEQHISDLIAILARLAPIAFTLVVFMYFWSLQNPDLAARVAEKFLDIPKRFLDIFHRILDMIEKKGEK